MVGAELSAFAYGTIRSLGLERHPEGGWYRRTWQSRIAAGSGTGASAEEMGEHASAARPLASLIYFLLPAGDVSAWHVVDADELWLWHGPGSVTLELGGTGVAPDTMHAECMELGVFEDVPGKACGQVIIPAGTWQRTLPADADALVSCVVSPGFTYAGFTLADD